MLFGGDRAFPCADAKRLDWLQTMHAGRCASAWAARRPPKKSTSPSIRFLRSSSDFASSLPHTRSLRLRE